MRRSRFFRARKDATQKTIVEALKKVNCEVHIVGYPCDLIVQHPIWYPLWKALECKPEKRKRKDQPEQDKFLARTGTPRVRSAEEALKAVGL